jgi:hypothetical protein
MNRIIVSRNAVSDTAGIVHCFQMLWNQSNLKLDDAYIVR